MINPFLTVIVVSNALSILMLFVLKIIDGVMKRVARIKYSNGTEVERIYPVVGNIPEDVKVLTASTKAMDTEPHNHHVADHIVNQEYLQYQYHFAGQ